MSLAQRRRAVQTAEARLQQARGQLVARWQGLRETGAEALTPGRLVVIGLVSGFVGGLGVGARSDAPRRSGDASRILLVLLQIVARLLPSLMPALKAGMAAARQPREPAAAEREEGPAA
jgi:hypothetical protein